jgi:(1->4)-alpha-D-glucan 1-alpha-D-glucosylmutase
VRASGRPIYIVVEKILASDESLPQLAGVTGTTGYEWLNLITRVLLQEDGCRQLKQTWQDVSGSRVPFSEILRQAKHRVLRSILLSEFTVLARLLARIAAGHYSTRDYTADALRGALELFVLHFPVYRTYIRSANPSARDRAIIKEALDRARAEWFGSDVGIFDFLNDALTLDLVAPGRATHSNARVRRFAFKVQQFTGPMMAKSLEDTAFYRYHANLALNEVGGDPEAVALPVAAFHERMAVRARSAPHGLTATATHDTKRGEDARARLIALSELAGEWDGLVKHWRRLNAAPTGDTDQPTAAREYMIYQALLGAWPLGGIDQTFIERAKEYVVKAAREGKQHTSWLAPDERYESTLTRFVGDLLDPARSADFIESFGAFARRCALLGALNTLAQVTLKLTMPGVPDLYQGTELWDLSFVDPDNRRPVDFDRRATLLQSLDKPDWAALSHDWQSGHVKLALLRSLLTTRNAQAGLFSQGGYQPVAVSGRDRDEVIAYARVHRGQAVIIAVGRHFVRASDGGHRWPDGRQWDARLDLSGFRSARSLLHEKCTLQSDGAVGALFRSLPVAVIEAERR